MNGKAEGFACQRRLVLYWWQCLHMWQIGMPTLFSIMHYAFCKPLGWQRLTCVFLIWIPPSCILHSTMHSKMIHEVSHIFASIHRYYLGIISVTSIINMIKSKSPTTVQYPAIQPRNRTPEATHSQSNINLVKSLQTGNQQWEEEGQKRPLEKTMGMPHYPLSRR